MPKKKTRRAVARSIPKKESMCSCSGSGKWFGIILIVLGVAWLLDVWKWLIPVILIVWGLYVLLKR